jgi:hypothetical protein
MPQSSFRLLAQSSIPVGNPRKQAVLLLALLVLTGCGAGSAERAEQRVRGMGYTFSAPADWKVARRAGEVRVEKGLAVLSVRRYPLLRAFRPELWTQVLPELDRAADQVAVQQHGTVTSRRTVRISGRQGRSYEVSYQHDGKQLVERLGFVLREKTEYLLLCRYERGGDTDACDRLVETFRLLPRES